MDLGRARNVLAGLQLRPDFLWGVATSAYQVEGGLNGPHQPCNNWAAWERAGRVEPAGQANRFWDSPDLLLDRAAALGLSGFRLGLEWARLEPAAGRRDPEALERYAEILLGCQRRGLEPVVTFLHFSHPAWLGETPWSDTSSEACLDRFVDHVQRTAGELGRALQQAGGHPPRYLVTLNEINVLPITSFVLGAFPPGRIADLAGAAAALDGLARAHVLAYDALHQVYEEQGWPPPVVTTNNYSFGLYELDRLVLDVITARQRGVGENALCRDLARRREAWNRSLEEAPRAPGSQRWLEPLLRPLLALLMRQGLPRCQQAVLASARAVKLDAVALDYYDPFPECCLRWPGRRAGLSRAWQPLASLWETPVNPAGLTWFLRRAADYGLPLLVLENGLCNERQGGRRAARSDGWTRCRYLRANLLALAEALHEGLPVRGYFHWTLVDNYEWGSYRPRFGLLGLDEQSGAIEELDSMGEPSAQLFAELIAALRGDAGASRERLFLGRDWPQ